jgi:hypothetical protein
MHGLILYGTSGCHLCEQAEEMLREMKVVAEYVDISTDDNLLDNYGTRIPVLSRSDNNSKLDWPFDAEKVTRFLCQ